MTAAKMTARIGKAKKYEDLAEICQEIDREVIQGRMSLFLAEYLCNRIASLFLELEGEEGGGDAPKATTLPS
jgi:hypothetical protein